MYKGKLQYCIKKENVVMYTLHKRKLQEGEGLRQGGGGGRGWGGIGQVGCYSWGMNSNTAIFKKAVNIFISSTDDRYRVSPP